MERLKNNDKVLPEFQRLSQTRGSLVDKPDEDKRTQAQRVIAKFGGVYQMQEILERHGLKISTSTIYRWSYPRVDPRYPNRRGGKTGLGGIIPLHQLEKIARAARLAGIAITDTDFDQRRI